MSSKIELTPESVDSLIVNSMRSNLDDIKKITSVPHFSQDPVEEKRKLKQLKNAFKIVAGYYGDKRFDLDKLIK